MAVRIGPNAKKALTSAATGRPTVRPRAGTPKSANGIERRARADRDDEREPDGENAGDREAPTRCLGHRVRQKADDERGASGHSDRRQNLEHDAFSFSV
jgi:hypothetical protein